MKLKIALTTATLVLAPTLGLAQGCNSHKHEQAMSCAAGSSYDSATKTCQPVTS